MKSISYGIIGLGQIALKGHIPALLSIAQANIVAISAPSEKSRFTAAQQIGNSNLKQYKDYHDLLADQNVDVVIIATPNHLHREQAIATFEAGKHLFCEKPLGINIQECNDILNAQKASGKLLQVGHELRYSEQFQEMRKKIDSGAIGKVHMMVLTEYRFPLRLGWRQKDHLTGGVMLEKNSHFFDLFNWLADSKPICVYASGANDVNKDSPLIDNCIVSIEYANGVRAALMMCLFSDYSAHTTFNVMGEQGRLIAYSEQNKLTLMSSTTEHAQNWEFEYQPGMHPGMVAQHEAMIRCINENAPILCDGQSAKITMEVALAAQLAVKEKTVIRID